MSDEKTSFDYRELPIERDAQGRALFPKIDGARHDAAYALRLRTAEDAIYHHTVIEGDSLIQWAKEMKAYLPDSKATPVTNKRWAHYAKSLEALVHAIEHAHSERDSSESELTVQDTYIVHAWHEIEEDIEYFRATKPDLAETHPLPTRETFSMALEDFYTHAMSFMSHPPKAAVPRMPTSVGEQKRAAHFYAQKPAAQPLAKATSVLPSAPVTSPANETPPKKVMTPTPDDSPTSQLVAAWCDLPGRNGISWYQALEIAVREKSEKLKEKGDEPAVRLLAIEFSVVQNALKSYAQKLTNPDDKIIKGPIALGNLISGYDSVRFKLDATYGTTLLTARELRAMAPVMEQMAQHSIVSDNSSGPSNPRRRGSSASEPSGGR